MKIVVKSYKPSGKWYHTEETNVELNSINEVLILEDKIRNNEESVQHLSGLRDGFTPYFTYMIELVTEDNLFMDFLIYSEEFVRRQANV